ncbi:MAG TPA: hypothetical protein VFC07_06940 [Verrucomicrobiae bacterium]|nr:hypothetical protein [Verrucomicrobiae bacterium]
MQKPIRFLRPFCCLLAAMILFTFRAGAHTLPISYLRLQPDADYLHLELVFNAFEISFISEMDDNKDGELDAAELTTHGQALANRVVSALKLRIGNRFLAAETAGMDLDMTGHHVRLRAHYKVDARRLPVTLESELNSITSASHLIQVTFIGAGRQQLAQLDAHWPKITFQPADESAFPPAPAGVAKVQREALREIMSGTVLLLIMAMAGVLWLLSRCALPMPSYPVRQPMETVKQASSMK